MLHQVDDSEEELPILTILLLLAEELRRSAIEGGHFGEERGGHFPDTSQVAVARWTGRRTLLAIDRDRWIDGHHQPSAHHTL